MDIFVIQNTESNSSGGGGLLQISIEHDLLFKIWCLQNIQSDHDIPCAATVAAYRFNGKDFFGEFTRQNNERKKWQKSSTKAPSTP